MQAQKIFFSFEGLKNFQFLKGYINNFRNSFF